MPSGETGWARSRSTETACSRSGSGSTPFATSKFQMIDILYLASHRPEFTEASLAALKANTDWNSVRALWMYCDVGDSRVPSMIRDFWRGFRMNPDSSLVCYFRTGKFGGPVAIMNAY